MHHSALHSHFNTSIFMEHSIMIRYSFTVSVYCRIDMYCRSLVGDSGEIDQLYPNYWELIIASKLNFWAICK